MLQKCMCLLLLLVILFSSSCQQKKMEQAPVVPVNSTNQAPKIPPTIEMQVKNPKENQNKDTFNVRFELDYKNKGKEEAILKEYGVSFSNDMGLLVAKVTQEQFDLLKQKNIKIYKKWEWVKIKDKSGISEFDNQNRFVSDAYKDLRDREVKSGGINFTKSRIYRDLNQDGIPEIFFRLYGGNGGKYYLVYQITKDGYWNMGTHYFLEMQVLQTKHNGFCDIMTYQHINASVAHFRIYEFNGSEYVATKEMSGFYGESIDEKIFQPDFQNVNEEDYNPKWSPKDDDKYRRMIK